MSNFKEERNSVAEWLRKAGEFADKCDKRKVDVAILNSNLMICTLLFRLLYGEGKDKSECNSST